jgi:acyl-CoA thioesterase FadM
MPRIKLAPLNRYAFSVELSVRITDINYGGHLGNDRMLSLVHEARVAFLAQFGYTEHDCGGVSLIIGDTAVQYKEEAFAGDMLQFEIAPGEYTQYGFRLFYRVIRTSDRKLIALIENGMVCLHPKSRELHVVPPRVKERFSAFSGQ